MVFARNCRHNFQRDERGAALIELTVVLPVLLAIGLGVFEFGNLIYNYHLISVGVRDAARYAAGLQSGSADPDAKCIALTGGRSGANCNPAATPSCTTTCRVSWWDKASTITITPTNVSNNDGSGNKLYRGGANITMVTVQADVPYPSLGFLGYFGLGPITLTTNHEERVFGVR